MENQNKDVFKMPLIVVSLLALALLVILISMASRVDTPALAEPVHSDPVQVVSEAVLLVDGQAVEGDVFRLDGVTYAPVRSFAKAAGMSVSWDATSSTVSVASPGFDYNVAVTLDGKPFEDAKSFIHNGSVYMPMYSVAKAAGMTADYNSAAKRIALTRPSYALSLPLYVDGVKMYSSALAYYHHDKVYMSVTGIASILGGSAEASLQEVRLTKPKAQVQQQSTAQVSKPAAQPKAEVYVYVSRTGTKYHSNPYCSNMKNPWYMTLGEALAMGRGACSKCY
jgi:hypothetical protein